MQIYKDSSHPLVRGKVIQQPADGGGIHPGTARFPPAVTLFAVVEVKHY